ncbi:GNAT family N-acetyltransferase [Marivita sp.]|uniref:GNAT family N-acetyltransferase n=1 Tax=Marivita sp. TaxID=2003365 RepID=UPI003A88C8AC
MDLAAAAYPVAAETAHVSLYLNGHSAVISAAPDVRQAALAMRAKAFRYGLDDEDTFDDGFLHGIVWSGKDTPRVAFRVRLIRDAADLGDSYTGQFYDLAPLRAHPGAYLELGRFCQAEGPTDVMALRLAWAALGVLVDRNGVGMMIGCSSFPGADPERHLPALAALHAHHLGPDRLRPKRLSSLSVDLPRTGAVTSSLPNLLRSYLGMGGWVSDHAVRDLQLDTLHVFTGLAIDAMPEARKARLRAVARAAQVDTTNPLDLARAAP